MSHNRAIHTNATKRPHVLKGLSPKETLAPLDMPPPSLMRYMGDRITSSVDVASNHPIHKPTVAGIRVPARVMITAC